MREAMRDNYIFFSGNTTTPQFVCAVEKKNFLYTNGDAQ
jgi:hypothetical protein